MNLQTWWKSLWKTERNCKSERFRPRPSSLIVIAEDLQPEVEEALVAPNEPWKPDSQSSADEARLYTRRLEYRGFEGTFRELNTLADDGWEIVGNVLRLSPQGSNVSVVLVRAKIEAEE